LAEGPCATTFTAVPTPSRRAQLIALATAALVIAATAIAGVALNRADVPLHADAAPLFGFLDPHVGPGTPLAVALAIAVVVWGPPLATRLPWRGLLAASYAAALAWTVSLALVDGWRAGIAERLTDWTEYLHDVPRVHDISAMIDEFTQHVLAGQPHSWTVHVSGHPPGALLVYTWLDRLGLGGGTWASVVTLLVGSLAAVAVPVTVKALHDERAARAVVPFVVLVPGAVWMGVSADGLFTGVTTTGIALLALRRALPSLLGGVLLGSALFLSYGLTLVAVIALAVVLVNRSWRSALFAAFGASIVVATFAAAGFWWLDGYHLVVQRYHQGDFAQRPYAYWVFGNLGALLLSAGPLTAAALTLATSSPPTTTRNTAAIGASPSAGAGASRIGGRGTRGAGEAIRWAGVGVSRVDAVRGLVLAAGVAVLVADLSGLSKAEVERIWLPFGVWFAVGGALLPAGSRRWWLGAQAVTALAVNHAIATSW
jgi:methylthioxylose transferase